jgi:hypothetical protein
MYMYYLNLNNYFKSISNLDYAIAKIDTPYNPKEFPKKYAIGKDLDIFVKKKDFEKIKMATINYFNQYKNFYVYPDKNRPTNNFILLIMDKSKKKNWKKEKYHNSWCHYQIDITVNDSLIKNRVKKENFYILSMENEKIVRLNELKKNPHKKHHKDWLDAMARK